MNKDTFCPLPFYNYVTKSDGSSAPCCRTTSGVSFIRDNHGNKMITGEHTMDEIWNSDHMKEIRMDLVNGIKRKECGHCWKTEEAGQTSKRMKAQHLYDNPSPLKTSIDNAIANDGQMSAKPKHIELRLGNICNLKCQMCSPLNSTQIAKERKELSKINSSVFYENAEVTDWFSNDGFWDDLLSYIEENTVLEFTGGEPTLIEEHYDLLERLIKDGMSDKIYLRYTTNATNVQQRWLNIMSKFKHVTLNISVDGVEGSHEYVRFPSKYKKVTDNIKILASHVDKIVINTAVSLYNIALLPEIFYYIRNTLPENIELTCNYIPVMVPRHFSLNILDDESKQVAYDKLARFSLSLDDKLMKRDINGFLKMLAYEHISTEEKDKQRKIFKFYTTHVDKYRGNDLVTQIPWLDGFWKSLENIGEK